MSAPGKNNYRCYFLMAVSVVVSANILLFSPAPVFAQHRSSHHTSDSLSLVQSIDSFLTAFRNLDWQRFDDYFADDATAFFPPSARFNGRANNKKEIEGIFKNVFANARKLREQPPYLTIEPRDLYIQLQGTIAIISFMLDDPGMLGRRTIVWKKQAIGWKIIHLHASGVAMQ